MAFSPEPSTSNRVSTRAVKRSKLPPSERETHTKHFEYEEMCFLAHYANYCTDFETLRETFNIQFNTDRSLDSIERVLTGCEDKEFFTLTEVAENYKKWYTEHPVSPVRPIILLGSRVMRTELRAYLAYHHSRGMVFADLKKNLNLTFPLETRDMRQIAVQLNFFKKKNQLLTSLTNFSVRYPWHPKYRPIAGAPAARAARARLDKGKAKADHNANNQAAIAAQDVVMNQRAKSEEESLATQRELALQRAKSEEESLAGQWDLIVKCTDMIGRIITGSLSNSTIMATNASLAATILGSATVNLGPASISDRTNLQSLRLRAPCSRGLDTAQDVPEVQARAERIHAVREE